MKILALTSETKQSTHWTQCVDVEANVDRGVVVQGQDRHVRLRDDQYEQEKIVQENFDDR